MSFISASVEACDGYGNCVFAAPAYFDIGSDGSVKVLQHEIADGDRPKVEHAVAECPAAALAIVAAATDESAASTTRRELP
ncbi:ferredoxin [Streptomyces marispadix]|uniref:Ferredoxin n=1 Tax=Streptomyces marispadix TaxID=2922868 RepID=A0ABS9T5N8_9ACTN|nr:ferredoxin [Streptomyces marispadix]MCH6163834.1 ferredoxin [Streptomyces marispadix]